MSMYLSKREREVLILVLNGKSHKEVAKELNIEVRTSKSHMSAVYRRLGLTYKIGSGSSNCFTQLFAKLGHFEIVWIPSEEYENITGNPFPAMGTSRTRTRTA